MGAVVFEPLESMPPYAVHCGFYCGSDDKGNGAALHGLQNGMKIVVIDACAVDAVLDTFSALDALIVIYFYGPAVIAVCIRHGADSYASVTADTIALDNVYH